MSDSTSIPPYMQPVQQDPPPHKRAATRFVTFFVLVQICALLLSYWIATTSWYMRHNAYPAIYGSGYSRRVHRPCEILLYGDSTALADLDPAVIEAKTGYTACNISESRPAENFIGVNRILDDYLATHPAPRLLVTSWQGDNFNLERPTQLNESGPEGHLYVLQFLHDAPTRKQMFSSPGALAKFLLYVEGSLVMDARLKFRERHDAPKLDERTRRDLAQGQWTYPDPPQTACGNHMFNYHSTFEQNRADVAEFRKRYTTPSMPVIVNLSPIADCDIRLDLYHRLTDGLHDNPLQTFPISAFNNDDMHMTIDAARSYSSEVADQILTVLPPRTAGSSTQAVTAK